MVNEIFAFDVKRNIYFNKRNMADGSLIRK